MFFPRALREFYLDTQRWTYFLAVESWFIRSNFLLYCDFMALCQQNGWRKGDEKSLHIKLTVFKWYFKNIWMLWFTFDFFFLNSHLKFLTWAWGKDSEIAFIFKGVFSKEYFMSPFLTTEFFVGVSPWNSWGKRSFHASSDHLSLPLWTDISR